MLPEAGAVLFDLDDTLYPWRRFALSGFAAVARDVAKRRGVRERDVFAALRNAWRGPERGWELQACARRFGLAVSTLSDLVDLIRHHDPSLRLPRSSRRALAALRGGWRLGIVTNGPPAAQARKVAALGVAALVDTVVYASEHGTGMGKPEAAPFEAALERLGVGARQAVFVGNDEAHDIVGAAGVGMRTILSRAYAAVGSTDAGTRADATVTTLDEVPAVVASLMAARSPCAG